MPLSFSSLILLTLGRLSLALPTCLSSSLSSSARALLTSLTLCVFYRVLIIFSCCCSSTRVFCSSSRATSAPSLHRMAQSSISPPSDQALLLSSLSRRSRAVASSTASLCLRCSCSPSASIISLISIALSKVSSERSSLLMRLPSSPSSLSSLLTAAASWALADSSSLTCCRRRAFSACHSSGTSLPEDGRNDCRFGWLILIFVNSFVQSSRPMLLRTPLCSSSKLLAFSRLLLGRGDDIFLQLFIQNMHFRKYARFTGSATPNIPYFCPLQALITVGGQD